MLNEDIQIVLMLLERRSSDVEGLNFEVVDTVKVVEETVATDSANGSVIVVVKKVIFDSSVLLCTKLVKAFSAEDANAQSQEKVNELNIVV